MKKTTISIIILSVILTIAIISGVWTFILKQPISEIRNELLLKKDEFEDPSQENLLVWVLENKLDSLEAAAVLLKSDQPELSEKILAYIHSEKSKSKRVPTFSEDEGLISHSDNASEKSGQEDGFSSKLTEKISDSDFDIKTDYIPQKDDGKPSITKSESQLKLMLDRNTVYYDGSVIDGVADGFGKGVFDNGIMYEGFWKNNLPNGKGVQKWPDGREYDGHFLDGKRSGEGTFTWINNEKYIGEWHNDKRHGKGVFYDKKGKVKYDGEWRSDIFIK